MSEPFAVQDSYAVLIGTSQYTMLPKLPAVHNNLVRLRELLMDKKLCGLPADNCIVVSDPTTNPEMLDPVREAADKATDTLIVYFAGHGQIHSEGNDLYLALVNADRAAMYKSTAYGYLRSEIRNSRAKRKIVILDCCYSGRAFGEMGSGDEPTVRVVNSAAVTGTYLIASTAENKASLAPEGHEYTAFTGELISIIQGGLPGEPPLLTVGKIFDHVRTALIEKGLPMPQRRDGDLSEDIPLFFNCAGNEKVWEAGYGPIQGVEEGTLFASRRELHDAKIHRPLQAGICGTAERGGAESIVVSGGYRDDRDYGTTIFYTGHGGRDPNTGVQISDQSLEDSGNAALIRSMETGYPVRVVRGAGGDPDYSPPTGYSYDGLFTVTDYWTQQGVDGPMILQFKLEQVENISDLVAWRAVSHGVDRGGRRPDNRRYAASIEAVRIKQLYDYACQICDTVLQSVGGSRIATVVYIQDLERPHNGPSVSRNMLCLCPNHAELFRYGAITISENFNVIDQVNDVVICELTVKHPIDATYTRYHREHHRIGPR
ncbi:hypothetical protein C1I98_13835 [Spongiactinospora gelatinilytica]|uniref:YDG domain-containing protein n=1 Tax=Spongiactinospora gelatinilytica TaxID=2666298 RepID=A0A2W2HBT4_9ACTN|nr:YDG/SRA domain-containing protein [Spongiactinospora gelatinilytica]PZG46988.1 hypothetical protein C1I98_13835 [Spongiactinospora gelatinilytica]